MTVRLMTGDCREVLKTLPDASVQCVVTSPPYYGLRDYGVAGQIGLEASVDEYVAEMVAVFREVRRVLRDDGTLWLNLGDSYANDGKWVGSSGGKHVAALHGQSGIGRQKVNTGLKPKDLIGIPWRVAFALQVDDWYLRSDIIWSKPNPMPESVRDRPTKAHEYIFLLSKQPGYFFDAEAVKEKTVSLDPSEPSYRPNSVAISENGRKEFSAKHTMSARSYDPAGRNIRSVWTIATHPYAEAHFATFPPDLAERCIKAGTSERGACAACGAPWVRVVERQRTLDGEPVERGAFNSSTPHRIGPDGIGHYRYATETKDLGWQPACSCAADVTPCVVLDPFAGAGTTGLVADRLGGDAILIELNPAYVEMARRRIVSDAPLFAVVGS